MESFLFIRGTILTMDIWSKRKRRSWLILDFGGFFVGWLDLIAKTYWTVFKDSFGFSSFIGSIDIAINQLLTQNYNCRGCQTMAELLCFLPMVNTAPLRKHPTVASYKYVQTKRQDRNPASCKIQYPMKNQDKITTLAAEMQMQWQNNSGFF